MFRSLRLRLAHIGRLPRLLAAATCLLLAAASALHARSAPARPPVGSPVVVAARDLPAGHVLTGADLTMARWAAGAPPDSARSSPATLVGARLAGPLRAREPVTSTRLLDGDLAAGLGPGQVATSVVLDDPHAVDLARPGDLVDLLATPRPVDGPEGADRAPPQVSLIAAHVPVLAVLPASDTAGPELVVAVARVTAVRIARDRPTQLFTVVVVSP